MDTAHRLPKSAKAPSVLEQIIVSSQGKHLFTYAAISYLSRLSGDLASTPEIVLVSACLTLRNILHAIIQDVFSYGAR